MSDLAQFEAKFRRLAELREQRDTDKAALKNSENAYREYEAELLETVADSSLRGSVEFDFGAISESSDFSLAELSTARSSIRLRRLTP